MQVKTHDFGRVEPRTYWLWLASDLHIGSAHADYSLIAAEVAKAKRLGARCLVNGDVFDLILPSDNKRYLPGALHRRIRGDDTPVNGAIAWAAELLEPIKGQLDVVGLGNHEVSTIRHHSFDPVSALCDRLGVAGAYGGYSGYWRGMWRREVRSTGSFLVRYHHGSGGGAPVTKGIIDLSRMGSWASDADLIWIGHKHNQLVVPMARERVRNSGRVAHDTVYAVMSGGYLDPLAENTAPSYAEQFGLGPQPKGGAFVALEVAQNTMAVNVKGVEFGV